MTVDFPQRVERAVASIRQKFPSVPKTAIILGSGLSGLAADFGGSSLSYGDIAEFPAPTVNGHAGILQIGTRALVMAGRFHYYEGHSLDTVCLPVAVLAGLGVENLILTNAAGGIHYSFRPGDLVLIADHINMQGVNPLIGPHLTGFGPRFCDMSEVYSSELRRLARQLDPELKAGVYLAVSGPCYESPAEIRAFRAMGADLVGMSTVPEAILARSLGLRTLGISCVTNLAAGIGAQALNHQEVMEYGQKVATRLGRLLQGMVAQL